jgi:anthranilate synthase/aminodeoxychorismate synthase-like glutamine amidotransferase
MKILFLENFDSFSWNIIDALGILGAEVEVITNIDPRLTDPLFPWESYSGLVISPGPDRPEDAGLLMSVLQNEKLSALPILGICLGMQAIGLHFHAELDKSPFPIHGKASLIFSTSHWLFAGIDNPHLAGRYHSLALTNLPENLDQIAWTEDRQTMAIQVRSHPWLGVQFHPESILSPFGAQLLKNWLLSLPNR